ncbi:unnamed protein product [Caenorhabditis sp. 36 PRJEB53466]|nr:unnamed protein product [Caenorhabditis sp. 36 PRJEB53466]
MKLRKLLCLTIVLLVPLQMLIELGLQFNWRLLPSLSLFLLSLAIMHFEKRALAVCIQLGKTIGLFWLLNPRHVTDILLILSGFWLFLIFFAVIEALRVTENIKERLEDLAQSRSAPTHQSRLEIQIML